MNKEMSDKIEESTRETGLMPMLFIGHGSPMNAIEENEFVAGWEDVARSLPAPSAILCISAHWETRGTFITAMDHPRTIHDFGGFPRELFEVQYPAPGSPELAAGTKDLVQKAEIGLDHNWGLDHGCWSVVKRMYPNSEVPVVQLSLDYSKPFQYHYDLANELSMLRRRGILIIGSGNMVHNLRLIDWNRMDEPGYGFEWANEANEKMKKFIIAGDHKSLIDIRSHGKVIELAIPTPEHYLPLLYVLALKEKSEKIEFFNDKPVMGSLSMTSVRISR
jgi:4,5-DOPA dioxygenase extradiol